MAYKRYAECSNCGFHGEITIKDGYRIEQKTCPTCGCVTLYGKGKAIKVKE